MVDGVKPHVGGPIAAGFPAVMIGYAPAARVGDMATCAGPPDAVAKGSPTVLIGGMPAARLGDLTLHGGTITLGFPAVMIGDAGGGGGGGGGGAGASSAASSAVSSAQAAAASAAPPETSAQSDALTEAAEEGTATAEHCPYAEH